MSFVLFLALYGPPIPLVAGRFLNVATLAGLLLYVTTYMATTLRRVATFKNNRQPAGIGRPYNDEYYHKIYRYMRLGAKSYSNKFYSNIQTLLQS